MNTFLLFIHFHRKVVVFLINLKSCCTAHNSKRRGKSTKKKSLARLIPIGFDFRFSAYDASWKFHDYRNLL